MRNQFLLVIHYIKEDLKIKYYVRYMDDFVLILKNKNEAKYYYSKVEKYLNDNLNLELNKKSRYFPSYLGIDFCGYKIYETHLLLRKRSKKKINKNIRKWNKAYLEGKLYDNVLLAWNSWLGHAKHACSYNLICFNKNKLLFDIEK